VFDQQLAIGSAIGLAAQDQALVFGGNFDRLFPTASDSTGSSQGVTHR
jgi:hypothetical protein